jgi:hypothetical protein
MSIYNHPSQLVLVIMLVILSNPIPTSGQHKAALKLHTFRTFEGLLTVGYEQAINNHISAELSLQGGYYLNECPNRLEDYKVSGISAIAALRYYPFTKTAVSPRGFFAYPAFRYIDFRETFTYTATHLQYSVGGNILSVGLGVGYKFVYRRVGLEAFVGWGAGKLNSDDPEYRNNIPKFFRSSIEEQEHFPQLDVALCYMIGPISKD